MIVSDAMWMKIVDIIPVFPDEIRISALARTTGIDAPHMRKAILSLGADFPLAEDGSCVCFPSVRMKEMAVSQRRRIAAAKMPIRGGLG